MDMDTPAHTYRLMLIMMIMGRLVVMGVVIVMKIRALKKKETKG